MDLAGRLPRGAGGDDRQVAGGPAPVRAPLRALVLPRRRGRGDRPRDRRGRAGATRGRSGSTSTSSATRSARRSSTARTATCATWPDWRSPPSAARARAPGSSASTSSGSAAPSASRPGRSPPTRMATSCPAIDRDQLNRFERHLRRELERDLIERTSTLPPSRPLAELDRALPTSPTQDLAAVHRAVSQMKRRLATLGHEQRGRRKGRTVDVRRTMRSSLETGGVPLRLRYRPKRPRRPEIYVLCDVSTSVTSASVFFLSVLHALHDSFRKLRSFVFIERISEVTEIFEHERDFRTIAAADLQRGRRRRRLRLHRLRPGLARVPGRDLRRARPALDRDRPRRRPHQRPRAARRGLRPGRGAGRAPVLAQSRAEALLELRRLGDGRLRAPLRRRLRVLDHPAPGELRQRRRRRARRATSAAAQASGSARELARPAPAARRRRGRRG